MNRLSRRDAVGEIGLGGPAGRAKPIEVTAPVERNHSLDALRASALLLGVFLHAALAYLPGPGIGWAVQDRSTHVGFGIFVLVTHSFRLPVFFLLAGFFGRLVYLRLGASGFCRNRLKRIAVPFGLGWLLVSPLLVFGWVWGSMGGAAGAWPEAMVISYREVLRQLGRIIGWGGPAEPGFPLTHLWFLYYLLLIYAAFLAVRWVALRTGGKNVRGQAGADAAVRFLFGRGWGLVALTVVTGGVLCGMQRWGIDTPDKTFRPHLAALALYGLVFALGWLLHRQVTLFEIVRRRWRAYAVAALVSTLPVLALIGREAQSPPVEVRIAFQFLYALMMWTWMFACLGLFLRFCARPSGAWRYLADSSYWVYILHLPVVVVLQVALSSVALGSGVKFAITVCVATAFCLASYHLFVRSTPIGVLLNGRRVPFPWGK
jgi:glucans biosynthesis protein C